MAEVRPNKCGSADGGAVRTSTGLKCEPSEGPVLLRKGKSRSVTVALWRKAGAVAGIVQRFKKILGQSLSPYDLWMLPVWDQQPLVAGSLTGAGGLQPALAQD